jgi:hypothetical protein
VFQGTIDEIRPTLTREALRSGLPAVLVNEVGERFSMVIARAASSCALADGKKGVQITAIYTVKPDASENYPIQNLSYCEPKL